MFTTARLKSKGSDLYIYIYLDFTFKVRMRKVN